MNRLLEPLLTTEQLAETLQIPVRTLRTWRTRGGGPPAVKVGKSVRYQPAAVRAWLDQQTEDRTPTPELKRR